MLLDKKVAKRYIEYLIINSILIIIQTSRISIVPSVIDHIITAFIHINNRKCGVMKKHTYLWLFLTSTLAVSSANAANMRCDNGIASTGDSAAEVLEKCGPAVLVEKESPNIDDSGFIVRGAAFIEYWTYKPTGGMIYKLRFLDDTLVDIRSNR